MRFLLRIQAVVVLVIVMFIGRQVHAQTLGFSVSASTNLLVGTNTLTYGIYFTNTSSANLTNAFVTNAFSTPITFISASNSLSGSNFVAGYNTTATNVIFSTGTLVTNVPVQLFVTIQESTPGLLTNSISFGGFAGGVTTNYFSQFSTNIVTQVAAAQSDLGISIVPPVQAVITNDWVTFDLMVTNLGPNAVANVAVTNTLSGVIFKSVSQSYSSSGSNQIFDLGTLVSGGSVDVKFLIQPTNVGMMALSASVGSPGLLDPNVTNNAAATNVSVISYLDGTILAVTNSGQYLDHQNGYEEQFVLLSNTGTNDVPAVRLVVTGLTNRLANAVGTNNGSPFVYYSTSLAAGANVSLLLQYSPRGGFAFTNGQLHAFAVPLPDWTPPAVTVTSTNFNTTRLVDVTNDNMKMKLVEFQSVTGRTYTVVYSDNILFSNAMIAPPSVVAPANRVQWLDYGPPTTVSPPASAGVRFYRVYQNP